MDTKTSYMNKHVMRTHTPVTKLGHTDTNYTQIMDSHKQISRTQKYISWTQLNAKLWALEIKIAQVSPGTKPTPKTARHL